ncbi:MAG: type IV toxin-antitoxin system AbiEi family antitoxin domain-containing protein, partial [bacterium]
MGIAEVSRGLRAQGMAVFTARDLDALFGRRDRRLTNLQLHQWSRKGWVVRLRRGWYELAYPEPAAAPDFHVANRIYRPSYVSLDAALSHYQIIPETAAQVTSVTPLATARFSTSRGLFTYGSVSPRAYTGYRVVSLEGREVLLEGIGEGVAHYA